MRDLFFKYQAQTTPHPLALEVSHAKGSYIFDSNNKKYLDFIAGVSACSLGHCHPKVVTAIKKQLDTYILPHPVIGKLSIREMLYFTHLHTVHHCEIIKKMD